MNAGQYAREHDVLRLLSCFRMSSSPMAFYLILVCLKIEYYQNQWFITILNLPTKIAIWPLP